MEQVALGGIICEMDMIAQEQYEKVVQWLNETIAERDELREEVAKLRDEADSLRVLSSEVHRYNDTVLRLDVCQDARDALREQIRQLTVCDCGQPLSPGKCGHCDNDE